MESATVHRWSTSRQPSATLKTPSVAQSIVVVFGVNENAYIPRICTGFHVNNVPTKTSVFQGRPSFSGRGAAATVGAVNSVWSAASPPGILAHSTGCLVLPETGNASELRDRTQLRGWAEPLGNGLAGARRAQKSGAAARGPYAVVPVYCTRLADFRLQPGYIEGIILRESLPPRGGRGTRRNLHYGRAPVRGRS